jgi:hypothetical protein
LITVVLRSLTRDTVSVDPPRIARNAITIKAMTAAPPIASHNGSIVFVDRVTVVWTGCVACVVVVVDWRLVLLSDVADREGAG